MIPQNILSKLTMSVAPLSLDNGIIGTAVLFRLGARTFAVTSMEITEPHPGGSFFLPRRYYPHSGEKIELGPPLYHKSDSSIVVSGITAFKVNAPRVQLLNFGYNPFWIEPDLYIYGSRAFNRPFVVGYPDLARNAEKPGFPVIIKTNSCEIRKKSETFTAGDLCSILSMPHPRKIVLASGLYVNEEDDKYLYGMDGSFVFGISKSGLPVPAGIVLCTREFSYTLNGLSSPPEKFLYFILFNKVCELLKDCADAEEFCAGKKPWSSYD